MRNIAVVYGGYSSEEEISLQSGKVVAKNLPDDCKPYLIRINNEGWFLEYNNQNIPIDKNDFSANIDGEKVVFKDVFIAIHGTPGEDGKLQAYFDMLGINYSTCNTLACALTFNKWTCNSILLKNGFKCAESVILREKSNYNINEILETVRLPCFVKPNNGGSSFGITKVKKESDLTTAIEKAFDEGTEVLIEEFIEGVEVTCGVVKIDGEFLDLPITEIVTENEFFDYNAKYKGESDEITPARISDELTKNIQQQSKEIFNLLNLKGLVRVDFIIRDNDLYVIEVNTVPGLTEASLVPQQVRAAGMTLKELFGGLLKQTNL